MKKSSTLLTLALAMTPVAAFSSGTYSSIFNYSYLEVSAVRQSLEFDGLAVEDTDLDGFSIGGSYAIHPNVSVGGAFVSAEAKTRAQFNGGGTDEVTIEVTGPQAFVLYHVSLAAGTDWMAGATYAKYETTFKQSNGQEIQGTGDDDASKSLFFGVQHQFIEQLQLRLVIDYDLDAEDDQDEISYEASVRYMINEALDAGLSFQPDDEGDAISISVRKYLF